MNELELLSGDGSSPSAGSGGASPSSSGSSSSTATSAAADLTLGQAVKAAREAKSWSRTKLDSAAELGGGTAKAIEEGGRVPGSIVLRRIANALDIDLSAFEASDVPQAPRETSSPQAPGERRPSAEGKPAKRKLFERKAKVAPPDAPGRPQARPAARRVSTSPLTESVLSFVGGGLEKMGQGPLGFVVGFTSPVAGEIVDDVVAGTLVDKIVQPLVRGSEKYQNLGALLACYGSVAWASNAPEAADQAYGLFQWSMTVLLPLQGKQMVKRQKDHQKAAEAMADVMPELVQMLGPDPIRGLWERMWQQPQPSPAEEPAVA